MRLWGKIVLKNLRLWGNEMAKITKKKTISIKGILDISQENNQIYVETDSGEALPLADILQDFDGADVAISVSESIDLA